MSRGFDGFDIDDFRGSDFGPDREVSQSPSSGRNKWTELHNIHREEERADRLDREAPDRSNRDRPSLAREERVQSDVESLVRQGLMKEITIADPEHNPTQVVTLTREGHKLLSRGKVLPLDQATYHGLKKPKEAFHDADLYRLYHKVSDEIESRGGKVLRVQLDYEMKKALYSC